MPQALTLYQLLNNVHN